MLVLHQNNSLCSKPDLTREVHSCKICNQLFLTNENLIRHQEFNIHCRPNSQNSEASKKDSAPQSVEANGGDSIFSRYTCHLCGKRFAHSSRLVNHHKLYHETVDDIFCEMCETPFQSQRILKNHACIRECEMSDFSAICQNNVSEENMSKNREQNLCEERVVETDSTVEDHQLKHKRRKFSCNDCDITLETESELQDHCCNPPHLCAVCKGTFDTKEELQIHECCHFRKETNQKVYVCKTCNIAFKTSEGLEKHQLAHPNGKKISCYFCDICDNTFKSKQTLNTHLYNVHLKEKPFKCQICNMSFIVENNYCRHLNSFQHLKRLSLKANCTVKKKRKCSK